MSFCNYFLPGTLGIESWKLKMENVCDFVAGCFFVNSCCAAAKALHFLFAQKSNQKMPIRTPTVSLCIFPLCRRLSTRYFQKIIFSLTYIFLFDLHFNSLRQYLEWSFSFGYTSRVLLYFRRHCSFANQLLHNLYFTYCSLEWIGTAAEFKFGKFNIR